jgi:hypothetical protein
MVRVRRSEEALVRKVFVCLACAIHYMPPESMRYESVGVDASPIHCANPGCKAALEDGRAVSGVPLELLERWALRAAEAQGEPLVPGVRRRARGRRPSAAPAGGRSKLR